MNRFAGKDLDKLDLDIDPARLTKINDPVLTSSINHLTKSLKWAREVLKHDGTMTPADKVRLLVCLRVLRCLFFCPD